MHVPILAVLIAWALAISMMTGCSGSHGWQFSIGAHPITAVQDQQQLDPRTVEARREIARKNG